MESDRAILSSHLGKRITIVGYYERTDKWTNYHRYKQYDRCCLLDIELNGAYACQHVWVHHSEPVKELNPQKGERIQLSGLVTAYKRLRPDREHLDYFLDLPEDIVFPNRKGEVPPVPEAVAPVPVFAILTELRTLLENAGGEDGLLKVLALYPQVKALSDKVGGDDALLELVKMLK